MILPHQEQVTLLPQEPAQAAPVLDSAVIGWKGAEAEKGSTSRQPPRHEGSGDAEGEQGHANHLPSFDAGNGPGFAVCCGRHRVRVTFFQGRAPRAILAHPRAGLESARLVTGNEDYSPGEPAPPPPPLPQATTGTCLLDRSQRRSPAVEGHYPRQLPSQVPRAHCPACFLQQMDDQLAQYLGRHTWLLAPVVCYPDPTAAASTP